MALEPISATAFRATLRQLGHPAQIALERLEQNGFTLAEPVMIEAFGQSFRDQETDNLTRRARLHFDLLSPSSATIYLITITRGELVEVSLHIGAEQESLDQYADNLTGWTLLAQNLLRREGLSPETPEP